MAAEHDDIMGQIYIAFGQGAGSMRVSRTACAALRRRYYRMIKKAIATWDDDAAQALERIRALGRMMAARATSKGRTDITDEGLLETAQIVETESATKICNG